jgi:glycosyltransferase involved in cell wall biosynthesis
MSKPRVVLDADVLGRRRTGDESYVSALLTELPAVAPELELAAVTRNPGLVPAGIEAVALPARSQVFRMSWSLPRLLGRMQPALAHFQHVVAPGYGGRAVVTIHDLSFERDPSLMGRRDRFFFRTMVPRSVRRADRVIVVSERTQRDLVDHYGLATGSTRVISNGVDAIFSPEGARPGGGPYVLFVGALQPRKDPVTAIAAVARLDGLRLLLVGPDKGSEPEARAAAERLGLDGRVEFLGHVEKPELAALYRGAECLVLPSRYEGFGLPVIEAMASGTPVVTTTAGALPEVAGGAAVLVEPGDAEALAGAIERAIAERPRLVEKGLARAGNFSWTETARRTADVYRELL